ncbi:hypothetical protein BZG36_04227 [Bifiguratus adelaidae]|uniref:tRNA (adenine(58)-N(1))-methyltransferase catalytic subunit TRM61 n=1 Tax=Bifiguratus adelaidae TaxID=1938954 RepID=A0A261XYB1_9FUNG|nr:hypothetical protein BZG36_04227 [Bifiguratus adelaidae]
MAFKGWKTTIEAGDHVIAYLTRESMSAILIKRDEVYNCRFGQFPHNDMIGKKFGQKMISHTGKGFMYLLHPTPELWTMVLPHRTQILYLPDISFISSFLDLKPGTRMIESGTGSGSFSHSIARTIAPTGKLFTFEYHKERADRAKQEFEEHGLGDLIQIEHRDVCKNGFGLEDEVHAVFLDLPAPWEAIGSAKKAFKTRRSGKICCFSPCIEQVTKTVSALNEHGFVDITMYECLSRPHDVKGYRILTVDDAIRQAKEKEAERERVRQENFLKRKRERDGDTTGEADTSSGTPTPKMDTVEEQAEMVPVSKTTTETHGHTSFLTFATFLPVQAKDESEANSV